MASEIGPEAAAGTEAAGGTVADAPAGAGGTLPLMSLSGVSQIFRTKRGEIPAVRDVSLNLSAGSVLCLVGESGSGKTTTARVAAGLNRPTSGRVLFQGRDVWAAGKSEFREFRRSVQYVHQDPYASLNPIRSVFATLTAPMKRHGLVNNKDEAWQRAVELLGRVDLTPAENFLTKYPHQLSGGQRQRVAVARALTLDPKLIIADESTSMLDVSIRISLLAMLTRLSQDLGVGFLFITHDLALAKYFGRDGDIAVMYLGRIVEHGPTRSVISAPQHPYTQALLSAIPEPDPDLNERKRAAGTLLRSMDTPSLLRLPSGCTFYPRCPRYEEGTCEASVPTLLPVPALGAPTTTVAPRLVACHLVHRDAAEEVGA
ncbi:MAG: ABC transporter ATP-binding protein [Actinocatenispora sp.]